MFKSLLRKFEEIKYILIMNNGKCELLNKYTKKIYLIFSIDEKSKNKEKLLISIQIKFNKNGFY